MYLIPLGLPFYSNHPETKVLFFNIMASSILTVDEIVQLNIVIQNIIKMEFEETISLHVVSPIVSFPQELDCWAPPPGQEMPLSLRMPMSSLPLVSLCSILCFYKRKSHTS